MKRIIITLSLMLAVTIILAGCTSQSEDSNQISDDTQTSNSENGLSPKEMVKLCKKGCNMYSGDNEEEIIANCETGCDKIGIMAEQGCEKFCSERNENWNEHWNSQETCLANCEADVNAYK